ncbi:MAG TPA: glycine cleavage system protein T, partial [Methanomicrobia archaeon]|nr:glycine cleavage system protein T [Methanomicrobia archaeon]
MRHLPLEKWHSDRAKMAPFAGWNMPLWYRGISDEHRAVRSHAGIFDISHMGEIFFSGDDALSFLQMVTTNDIRKPPPISGTYSLVLNERGGIKDETLVFNMGDGEYMMVCDAVAV